MFKYIEPEVAGGLGVETEMDFTAAPSVVYLHYEFQGWLGNDILECYPCFIVTDALKEAILKATLTGVDFHFVKVTTSYEFRQLYPDRVLPGFNWMKISGKEGEDDFSLSSEFVLIVSEKAYNLLSLFNISAADVQDYG